MYHREYDLTTYTHSNRRHWAMRTVRQGRVKICGEYYYPDTRYLAYDGRLDGQRFLFGRYPVGETYLPYVCLWGSVALALAPDDTTYDALWGTGPEVVEGTYPWEWWGTEADLKQKGRWHERQAASSTCEN